MANKNVATYAEVAAAQAFLRYLGANWTNNEMIQAVISWFRQESGSLSNVRGNNPFNIRNSPFAVGYRQTASNGHFAIFKDLNAGFQAAAYLLLHANPAYGYGLVVAAARAGSALDFLMALAMSSWDAGHYGYGPTHPQDNHLISVYNSITGLTLSAPPKPKTKTKVRARYAPKMAPQLPPAPTDYIDGFAAKRFYGQRPHVRKPLPE